MKLKTLTRRLFTVAGLILLLASCTKEITPIGLDLLSGNQLLSMGYNDSTSIVAYSTKIDSVYTGNLSYALVGSMNDPVFGRTDAGFYSQVYMASSRLRFGTNPVMDSAFLYLPFKSSFGDTLSNTTWKVYRLTEDLYDSVHVYSNQTVNYDQSHLLGQITFQPRPHDSSYYGGSTNTAGVRIPLDRYVADYIFAADTSSLNTAANFNKYFKGICVVAEAQDQPGKGSIVVISAPSDYCRMVLHYHNTDDTTTSTFYITTDCARFNTYQHSGYQGAVPSLRQQLAGDTASGSQFLFLQGLGGVKVRLRLPDIYEKFKGKNILVNDAQLVVSNLSPSGTFIQPSQLALNAIGENGTQSPFSLVDEDEGSSYFDGYYNSSTETYRFRLTRYVQQALLGKINASRGLYLSIPSPATSGTRLVLNGTASSRASVKLYLRYTILP